LGGNSLYHQPGTVTSVASQYDGLGTQGSSSGEFDSNDEDNLSDSQNPYNDSVNDGIPQISARIDNVPAEPAGPSSSDQDARNRAFSDMTAGEKADDELDSDLEML
jgi:hypothetical protein